MIKNSFHLLNLCKVTLTSLVFLLFSACSSFTAHHFEVQQGNVVEQSQINKLEIGMKKEQVHFILGSPMLKDIFHMDRWDFYYSVKDEQQKLTQKRLVTLFNETGLYKINGDFTINKNAPEEKIHRSLLISEKHYEEESKWYDTIFWWNARKN